MNRSYGFSHVTKDYLDTFDCILDAMIEGMTSAELTDSISCNFIVQMIPHHQGAIGMSRNLLKYTTNIPLQNIALNIIEEQTQSIADMKAILCTCRAEENCPQELCRYQEQTEQIMQHMFCEMEHACASNHLNSNFIREMIPHHRGAIAMSENALRYCICPELIPILESIIISQRQGVQKMQRLLRCMGCC